MRCLARYILREYARMRASWILSMCWYLQFDVADFKCLLLGVVLAMLLWRPHFCISSAHIPDFWTCGLHSFTWGYLHLWRRRKCGHTQVPTAVTCYLTNADATYFLYKTIPWVTGGCLGPFWPIQIILPTHGQIFKYLILDQVIWLG